MMQRALQGGLRRGNAVAIIMATAVVAYVAWKVTQSPTQATQFALNGVAVGAVYALLAMGFTIVYSTVWFFDLYYGAAAALGAYGVFYLRAQDVAGGFYDPQHPAVTIVFALVVAGVVAWALAEAAAPRLRGRVPPRTLAAGLALCAAAAGVYTGLTLTYTDHLHLTFGPLAGVAAGWLFAAAARVGLGSAAAEQPAGMAIAAAGVAVAIAVAVALAMSPGANLYLSWAVSCALAGCVGLGLYRGLYVTLRQRARSPLVMLVASMGLLLATMAFITIVFGSAARTLPEAIGSDLLQVGGASIKVFNIFTVGVSLAGFALLLWLLHRTSFGREVRAISDDEDVAKVVGINTTVVISVVFFIGAVYAAAAGILTGHDTALQPRMGLLLLLKGWIASVIGGIGNLYGALIGGFALGLIEQFGIWDLAGEWKDVISFGALILFLSFWPRGLLPRN